MTSDEHNYLLCGIHIPIEREDKEKQGQVRQTPSEKWSLEHIGTEQQEIEVNGEDYKEQAAAIA